MRLPTKSLVLAAAGALAGFAANALSPRPARFREPVRPAAEEAGICRLPGALTLSSLISAQEAVPMCVACSAAFVDARGPAEYGAGHVSGAVHLQPGETSLPALLHLERFRTVVVYDGEPGSERAENVAAALRAKGLTDIRVLAGAWPAWIAAGGPGESGPCGTCADRPAEAGR